MQQGTHFLPTSRYRLRPILAQILHIFHADGEADERVGKSLKIKSSPERLKSPQCEIVLETRDARLVRRRPRRRSSSTCCFDDGGDAIVPNQGDFTFEGLTN